MGKVTILHPCGQSGHPPIDRCDRLGGVRLLLNLIWLFLCGFWMAIGYVIAGIICCILIITIPFGLASFRIANYALWPFGRTIEPHRDAGAASAIGNLIWIIFAGWWLALGHVVTGIALCVTIIGIPLGIANFKMIPVSLIPLGSRIVPTS
ncbi:Uncharacterized membrane protein YccF, DUF307 family [Actinokineospora diospyrosa]|uniref:Uncharacterized membrane protein YccF, DUF307 family n=1 Tax=Actinokineospora diospyrosa TaxID=103728 RepID=A0ABT1IGZ0_9PSEU|nr:Uncharacterized membrane protein YccF, DUF307 family [Actinokineospora diospyrosa]